VRRALTAITFAVLGCAGAGPKTARVDPARAEAQGRVEAATRIVRAIREGGDGAIPIAIARGARCVAVVPGLIHAGVIVGARAGRGIVTCIDAGGGWTAPSSSS
jgi:lipid-binding SYLF domain-containing protein